MKSFVINFPGETQNEEALYQAVMDSLTVKGSFDSLSTNLDAAYSHVYIALESIKNSADGEELLNYVWGEGEGSYLHADILSAANSPLGVPTVEIYLTTEEN